MFEKLTFDDHGTRAGLEGLRLDGGWSGEH